MGPPEPPLRCSPGRADRDGHAGGVEADVRQVIRLRQPHRGDVAPARPRRVARVGRELRPHEREVADAGPLPGAGNRRFRPLSALRAHTKAPYKTNLHRKTLMALNRPKAARTASRHSLIMLPKE